MTTYPKFKDPEITKEQAILAAGSKAKLARALGVARSTVTDWKEIPLHQAYRLAQIYPELNNE
jgi:DNA-binding transcriptional regulator YdaS (Cro superfamily)